jgi:hypothetical protein
MKRRRTDTAIRDMMRIILARLRARIPPNEVVRPISSSSTCVRFLSPPSAERSSQSSMRRQGSASPHYICMIREESLATVDVEIACGERQL